MNKRVLTVLAVTAGFGVTWTLLPDFAVAMGSYIGLYSLVAMGLVVLTGVAGMTSFGQAAFVGVGAYATAWICTSPTAIALLGSGPWLPWIGLLLGVALVGLLAAALGSFTVKLQGHYLPLCTIAWGLSLFYLLGNLQFLGGHTGVSGIPPLEIAGKQLTSPRVFGVIIWATVLVAYCALWNLLDSREGRAIRALKSGSLMAESMGVNTARYRMKAFILAALLAGLSGWLYAHYQRFVNPTPFHLNLGIDYLFMAVVGGSGHLVGAVVGATLITVSREQLQDVLPKLLGGVGNFEVVVFGLIMVFVLQRLPLGVWPAVLKIAGRFMGRKDIRVPHVKRSPSKLLDRERNWSTAPLLETESVTKRFGGLVANDSVSISLRAGEIHALIGPNGAGKSTFFNIISGVDDPTVGEVKVLGESMKAMPSREFAARGIGRTFQHVKLLDNISVLENVAIGAHWRARSGWFSSMLRLDRAEESALLIEARRQIERCGLSKYAEDVATSLPLGKQRVVEIARALAGKPSALLLDEPAAGLRHLEKKALATLLTQLRAEGMGILIIEHDMEFVMDIADRITVLDFGTVIGAGTPAEIRDNATVLNAYLGQVDESSEVPA
jgi:branched-chain amino acid transport system permease protein